MSGLESLPETRAMIRGRITISQWLAKLDARHALLQAKLDLEEATREAEALTKLRLKQISLLEKREARLRRRVRDHAIQEWIDREDREA